MAPKSPLALIHAGLGKAANWRPFLNALGGSVSPLLIELPGHGLAEDYEESRDFSDQAVELALDEMPSDPVALVGHSYGAAVALRIAVERPYRISSLVLIEPVLFAAVEGRWVYDKLVRDLAVFRKRMEAAEYANAAKELHAIWGDGTPWKDLPGEQKSYVMERMHLMSSADPLIWEDSSNLLGSGRLEKLEMPVTFIDGGDSHPVIAEVISTIGDRFSNAEWVTIPGAGHMLPVTHPEGVAEAIAGRLFI